MIDEATDAYYSASRRFLKKLEKELASFGREAEEIRSAAERLKEEAESRPTVFNRIRDWLVDT